VQEHFIYLFMHSSYIFEARNAIFVIGFIAPLNSNLGPVVCLGP
jgi:hypothetical protein